jgi:hypothetical protein
VHWRSRYALLVCMACGDRIDETILANRRGMLRGAHTEWKARLWDRIRGLVAREVSA